MKDFLSRLPPLIKFLSRFRKKLHDTRQPVRELRLSQPRQHVFPLACNLTTQRARNTTKHCNVLEWLSSTSSLLEWTSHSPAGSSWLIRILGG
jgi:hypothetical protein